MTGPSLKKQDSHSSIHEASLNEARELRELYSKCLENEELDKALQVAEVIIEHWETRTLKHAESEEEGLYKEMMEENSSLKEVVIELTRDHNIMRKMVHQMKSLLEEKQADDQLLKLMDGLIIVDEIHNEDEMNNLLGTSGR